MKRNIFIWVSMALAFVLIGSCLDPYNPPASQVDVNYLVVDGFINTNGTTQIKLSRTTPLNATDQSTAEGGASLTIVGEGGSIFTLNESFVGTYSLPPTTFDVTQQYKLNIKTADHREYASDFVTVKEAAPIDSIRYTITGEDLQLLLTSHDDQNNTRYYLWKFVETWKYHARYNSEFIFDKGNVIARADPYELYNCWSTANSTQIMIGSSAKLAQDVIQDFPFYSMDVHDKKLQSKYSILVKQFAVTQEAYEYWELLKKSTETNGTIFDPQPSQGLTNIHCVTSPDEPVVGYLSAGSYQEKRIFIDTYDLPNVRRTTGYEMCVIDTLLLADLPTFDGVSLIFTGYYDRATLLGYFISTPFCIDCRLNGGSNTEPPFWQ